MQNCGIKVENKNIIDQIKKELKPMSYVECGNCGAVKVDTKELARTIHRYTTGGEVEVEEDDVYEEEMNCILYSIIEVVFKGVTYESLQHKDFIEAAKKAFPNLDVFHEEYETAKQKI